jgi:hypothetical protein
VQKANKVLSFGNLGRATSLEEILLLAVIMT